MIFVEPNNEYTNRKAAEKRAANEQLIRTLYGPSRWEDGWDESIRKAREIRSVCGMS
jgi:hypothetical protein